METTERWKHHKAILGLAVFVAAFAWFWWITGDMFKFGNDEGIYLEGGRRVALGQQPYRDFFALTGPLTFWIEGLLARWSGDALGVMRLPMVLDVAFLVWAVYWVSARYASSLFSAAMALTFLVYETQIPKLAVNHRWDSAALGTAAVVVALEAHQRRSKGFWMAAGLLGAAAGWATPSVLIVAVPLLLWAWSRGRRELVAFLGGGALVTAVAAAYLEWNHALIPLIRSMLWTGANYTAANRVAFGQVVRMAGGARDVHAIPFTQDLPGAIYILLAAILPIAAMLGWCLYQRRSEHRVPWAEILPLLGATAALLLSAWPRWTSDELFYTAALSAGLCAGLIYFAIPDRSRRAVGIVLLLAASAAAAQKAGAALDRYPFPTRVGVVHGTGEDREFIEALEQRVPEGDSMFAFPYLPLMYYLLNARNPTRYSYLQPGMMNADDEVRAIAELSAAPPRWVIFEEMPPAAILILWPGSDPARIPMAAIHRYLDLHYRDVETVDSSWGRFVIKKRIPDSAGPMPR